MLSAVWTTSGCSAKLFPVFLNAVAVHFTATGVTNNTCLWILHTALKVHLQLFRDGHCFVTLARPAHPHPWCQMSALNASQITEKQTERHDRQTQAPKHPAAFPENLWLCQQAPVLHLHIVKPCNPSRSYYRNLLKNINTAANTLSVIPGPETQFRELLNIKNN